MLYGGTAIGTAPFNYTVLPAAPSASMSFFNLSIVGQSPPHINADAVSLSITTRDAYGNRVYWGKDVYALSFAPDVLSPAVYPSPVWDPVRLVYSASVVANVAVSSQLYISLASADLSSVSNIASSSDVSLHIPYAIFFLPGPASNFTSSLQAAPALSGAVAGQTESFSLNLRDASGNLITSPQGDAACQTANPCSLNGTGAQSGQSYPVVCQWSLSAMQCAYTAYTAGSYQLNLQVNGQLMQAVFASSQVTVVAAAVSPAMCQVAFYSATTGQLLPSLMLTAAVPVLVSVSTYDAYGNAQLNGLGAGVLGSSATAFTATAAPVTGLSVSPFATANGFFISTATITGQITGSYELSVSIGQANVAGVPFLLQVIPGAASALSYVQSASTAFPPLVAGSNSTITIASLDAQGNLRVSGGSGADYLVQLTGIASIAQLTVADSSTQLFPVQWGSTASGNFSLSVQVRSSGANVVGSPFSLSVQPALSSAAACRASGDGYTEAISGATGSFQIAAADAFGNAQWPWLHPDTFMVNISADGGVTNTTYSTTSLVTGSSVSGVYSLTYAVPSGGSSTFVLAVFLLSPSGVWQAISNSPSLASVLPSNTSLSTSIGGADYPYPQLGRVNVWSINDTSASTPSTYLSVLLSSQDGSVHFSGTAVAVVVNSKSYTFSFIPAFYLPLLAAPSLQSAPFLVNVSRAGLPTSSSPVNVTFSAGPLAAVNCPISDLPSTVVVGTALTFSVSLFDANLNRISSNLSTSPNATAGCSSTVASSTTGSQTVWQLGVWNASDYAYHFTLNLTVACIYSLQVLTADGSVLSGQTRSITAQPDVVSALACSASPASASSSSSASLSTTAGASVSLLVLLNDRFGNPVDPASLSSANPNASLLVSVSDGASTASHPPRATVAPSVYTGQLGRYSVQITPYKASLSSSTPWPVVVQLAGVSLTSSSPINLSVSAASIVSATVLAPTSLIAGAPFILGLSLFDAYGNAAQLTSGAFSLSAFVATPSGSSIGLSLGSGTSDGMFIRTAGSSPASAFTFILNSTQTAGLYAFSLRGNGALVPSAQLSFTVLAESISVPNTLTTTVLNATVAGVASSLSLQLRDVYGNVIANASYAELLQVQLWTWSGTYTCDSALWSDDTVMPEQASSSSPFIAQPLRQGTVTFDSSSSLYTIPYTVYVSGRFTINVTVAGVPLPCGLLLPALAQNFLPAAPSPMTSQVLGIPALQVAGQSLTLFVDLYDAYGNPVQAGPYAVAVPSNLAAVNSSLPPSVSSDPSSWLVASLTSTTADASGRFTVVATPSRSAVYSVVITLNAHVLSTYSSNSTIADAYQVPATFAVIPSSPAAVTAFSLPSSLTAAVPFSLYAELSDAYGNFLSLSNPWYSVSLSVQGQTLSPSDYAFSGLSTQLTAPPTADLSNSSVSYGLQSSVVLQWTATSVWTGAASLQLTGSSAPLSDSGLSMAGSSFSSAVSVTVLPATCAALNPALPYRCPSQSCAVDYSHCSDAANGGSSVCPSSSPYQCAEGGCVSDSLDCPCPFGLTRCPSLSRVCVSDVTSDCFPAFTACTPGTVACVGQDGQRTGQCRFSAGACPSPAVCPPSYSLCPDLHSCAASNGSCADYAAQNGQDSWAAVTVAVQSNATAGPFRCGDGSFVAQFTDCSTPKTCPVGSVLCLTDQSCQPSASHCPAAFDCYAPLPFRCPTGDCRSSAADCPASITCPVGYLRCDNDACVASLSDCLAAFNCSSAEVRCSDGSCRPNLLLCPSSLSCSLSSPVACSDGSCASSAQYCPRPSPCPSALSGGLCPDGSCVQLGAACPVAFACPASRPVLCDDSVTCAVSSLLCPSPVRCAAPNVIRCPDGSCRRATADCPTATSCPSNRPIRCLDGSCAYAASLCPDVDACPTSSPVRCGGGECVESLGLCPTHVTCSPGTSRCADGSCRFSCPTTVELSCPSGSIACPQASSGLQCEASLSQCPQQAICPPAAPVRCIDSSCAASLSACPALQSDPPSSLLPCPDGSWTADVTTCGTLVSCPSAFPYKCLDETCRLSPSDCPLPAPCANSTSSSSSSSSSSQFRCLNGACVSALTDAQCQTNSRVSCTKAAPFKCAGSGEQCVADLSLCPPSSLYSASLPSVGSSGVLSLSSLCPSGFASCRDGSCVSDISACPVSSTCPVYLPYLCPSGVCASNSTACPDPVTGCYPLSATPHGCWNGLCVASASQCPTTVPSNCVNYCLDGSCPPVSITLPSAAASWCQLNGHDCALFCADGSCGLLPNDPTQSNLCTAGGALTGAGSSTHPGLSNVCPAWAPSRCDSGLCVTSSLNCTTLPSLDYCRHVANGATPYQCANGDCVVSSIQCPVVYPCPIGLSRCGDATCRLPSTCPPYGNTCPTFSPVVAPLPDGSNRHPRCDNGLCAPTSELSSCVDLNTGCSVTAPFRCGNGGCVQGDGSACDNVTLPTSNGCPAGLPVKCVNGQCVDDSSDCPMANGCPASAPFRCSNGDGSCQTTSSACSVSTGCPSSLSRCADGSCPNAATGSCPVANGCPALTPWRCADGSCKRYPATALQSSQRINRTLACPLTVSCPSGQSLCYDGSCAASPSLCPPAASTCTAAAPVLCPDLSCSTSLSACAIAASVATSCPTAVPIACDSGACVSSVDQCFIYPIPGVSAGGLQPFTLNNGAATLAVASTSLAAFAAAVQTQTGNATLISPTPLCPPSLPYACFDGSCRTSWSACQTWSLLMHGTPSSQVTNSTVDALASALCDSEMEVLCPNGYCAPASCLPTDLACIELGCGVVAACDPSSAPVRCPDGSCANATAACPAMPDCPTRTLAGYAAFEQRRCEDGACRVSCLPFDGCPLSAPYSCINRECAVDAAHCASTALGVMFVFDSSDLQEVVAPSASSSLAQLQQTMHSSRPSSLPLPPASVALSSTSSPSADGSASPLSSGATTACWSSCWSQVKASTVSFQINTLQSTTVSVLSNGYSLVQSSLTIPANALQFTAAAAAAGATSNGSIAVVSIAPVADSRMRGAENRIPASREADFGSLYLTYPETVVSAAFELSVDGNVAVPFALGLSVHFSADLILPSSSSSASFDYGDLCLGQLVEFPVYGFSYWECVLQDEADRVAIPVYNATRDAGLSSTVLTGYVSQPGVFAFIRSPAPGAAVSESSNFIRSNLLIIVLCLGLGVAFIAAVLYVFKRLHRYRAKYHAERDEVKAKREEVQEMEMFGGAAGKKDEEVVMTTNPLKLQLQDLTFQQAAARMNPLVNDQPAAAPAAAPGDAGLHNDAVALRARQHAHRMHTIAQLQADHAMMNAEMTELMEMLVPGGAAAGKTDSEETKEQPTPHSQDTSDLSMDTADGPIAQLPPGPGQPMTRETDEHERI